MARRHEPNPLARPRLVRLAGKDPSQERLDALARGSGELADRRRTARAAEQQNVIRHLSAGAGVSVAELATRTGLPVRRVRDALYVLRDAGTAISTPTSSTTPSLWRLEDVARSENGA